MQGNSKLKAIFNWLNRPKSTVFLTFVIISFLLWMLIKLTKEYVYPVSFNTVYKNLPEDKLFLESPEKEIQVQIEGTGFKMLKFSVFNEDLMIDLSHLKSKKNMWFLLGEDIKQQIQEQYRSVRVNKVLVDSVFFNLGINKKKLIPVKSDIQITYKSDYGLVDSLWISPSEIWVRGPENIVDTLSCLYTQKRVFKGVQSDIHETLPLKITEALKILDFEVRSVEVEGKVDRFSEKLLKVPLILENVPEHIKVRTFPQEIDLLCRATIEDLSGITTDDFKVVADFSEPGFGGAYLIPKIKTKPDKIKNIRLVQSKVEFLIKKE